MNTWMHGEFHQNDLKTKIHQAKYNAACVVYLVLYKVLTLCVLYKLRVLDLVIFIPQTELGHQNQLVSQLGVHPNHSR